VMHYNWFFMPDDFFKLETWDLKFQLKCFKLGPTLNSFKVLTSPPSVR
jgi:hypothetical protein